MNADGAAAARPSTLPPPVAGQAGLRGAVAAEWTKFWSVTSIWFWLLAAVLLMAVHTFYYGVLSAMYDRPVQPVGNAPASAMIGVQFAVVGLAVQVVTSEYSTGSIRTSLLWVPLRNRLLLAKSVVVGAVTFVAGVLLGIEGVLVAWPSFRFHAHATFVPAEVVIQVLLVGGYAALIGVFAVGAAAAVRTAAGALAVAVVLLAVVPGALLFSGSKPLIAVYHYVPTVAGVHFMQRDAAPYPAAVGFAAVAGWTAVTYGLGSWVLCKRDA
jgi:ABC-2 type transport system permease protein